MQRSRPGGVSVAPSFAVMLILVQCNMSEPYDRSDRYPCLSRIRNDGPHPACHLETVMYREFWSPLRFHDTSHADLISLRQSVQREFASGPKILA
jgi:hypothetical protein